MSRCEHGWANKDQCPDCRMVFTLRNKIAELEAELAALKSQEPVAWMTQSGNPVLYKSAERAVLYGWNPLFLAAGAQVQAQPVQREPVGYVYLETDYLSRDKHLVGAIDDQTLPVGTPLYAAPVPVWTDADIAKMHRLADALDNDEPVQQESVDVIATMNVIRSNLESYAAPVQAQERKPLLVSDIVTMYAERPTCDADMIEFAREIEKAHGIKEPV